MSERAPAYRAAQVRAAERPLIEAGEPLMRRAAAALAGVVADQLGAARSRVLVLAGSGDNGGDALFAAAELTGIADVDLFLTSDRAHDSARAEAVAAGAREVDLGEVAGAASDYDLVLDGILGIGAAADPALRGRARAVVEALLPAARQGRPRIVAVDLPSGLHPDTGTHDGVVLPAAVTVTFGAVKVGLVRAPELVGSIVLVDLGLGDGLSDAGPVGEASVTAVVQG